MDLTERQLQILQAVISDYVQNAEPVGSRSISKKYNLGVSPATIRNEMADLEEMGYLTHPHTSAGRIPSDKAYRLYVNNLMQKRNLTTREKRAIRDKLHADRAEFNATIRHAAELLSEITHLASFAMTPVNNQDTLNFIKLLPVDERTIVMMIVADSGSITNTTMRVNVPYTAETLEILSKTMTVHYKGTTIDEALKANIIEDIGTDIEAMNLFSGNVMPSFMKTLEDMLNVNLYTEGLMNIFNIPEYSSIDKARDFLELFSKKEEFTRNMLSRGDGIIVTIGEENMSDSMKDCSLITASYHVDGKLVGKVGVIGPTRMKYDEVTSIMEYLTNNLSESFKLGDGKDE
ncbi:MAG: heat-inducible transcriptional repressor HrcA [Firmicutes bacterium]|nr:heat-inducible transcriptional repressor HrcA [Bacillota bacterium]